MHTVTCLYTLEKNGMVERKHRHVVETGLILLAKASLSLKFRPDSFSTAIYFINRLPTKVLEKTLIEKLANGKLDYKSFGCLYFPWLRPYNGHKLDFRSSPCIFRHAQNQKGYKCLTNNSRIIISKHVNFNEQVFPFFGNAIKTSQKVYNPKISIPTVTLHQEQSSGVNTSGIQSDPGPQLTVSDFRQVVNLWNHQRTQIIITINLKNHIKASTWR